MTRLRPFAATVTLALVMPAVAFADDAPAEKTEEAPVPIQIEIDVAAEEAATEAEAEAEAKHETETETETEHETETEDPLPGGVVGLPDPEVAPQRAPSVRVTVDVPPPPPTYSSSGDVPDGYYLKHRRRKGLMIAGGVTFGVAWLASIAAARYTIEERDPDFFDRAEHDGDIEWPAEASLMIPVAGPWMALAQLDDQVSGRDKLLIAGSGLAQLGGLAMLGVGLFYEDTVLVKKESVEVSAAPLLAPGVAGAALTGSF